MNVYVEGSNRLIGTSTTNITTGMALAWHSILMPLSTSFEALLKMAKPCKERVSENNIAPGTYTLHSVAYYMTSIDYIYILHTFSTSSMLSSKL